MLAHKAEEEAVAVAENIAGKHGQVNYDAIPSVVYTFPASRQCRQDRGRIENGGLAYKVGKFPFTANARAKTMPRPRVL